MDSNDAATNASEEPNDKSKVISSEIRTLTYNQRSRRIDELESSSEVKLDQTKEDNSTFSFFLCDDKEFGYMRCKHCRACLINSRGGHRTRHVKKECISLIKAQASDLAPEVLLYCMESGSSFNSLDSEKFQKLIRSICIKCAPSIDVDNIIIPSRKTLRTLFVEEYANIHEEIGKKIREQAKRKTCSLLLDFGTHFHQFLSVFAVFPEETENEIQLRVLPYAFKASMDEKTAENVRDMLVESGEGLGLSREEVLRMNLVTDGAKNLEKMGKLYFGNWAKCACHLIQKCSERVLTPLKDTESNFTKEQLAQLKLMRSVLSKCTSLAQHVHAKKKELPTLPKLPSLHVVTRWQTAVKCCRDVMSLLPTLTSCGNARIEEQADEVMQEYQNLNILVNTLEKFEPLLLLFEKSDVTIHLFLPKIMNLLKYFKDEEVVSGPGSVAHTLFKSARVTMEYYIDKDISDMHIITTALYPKSKKMSKLTEAMKNRAKEIIEKELGDVELDVDDIQPPEIENNEDFDEIEIADKKDEYIAFLDEPVPSEIVYPLKYWHERRYRFPKLSRIAMRYYSVFTSESICERSFSAVKQVITSDRYHTKDWLMEQIMIAYFYKNDFH
ncbi:unnamed protein product [Caenorhabditis nigoni]